MAVKFLYYFLAIFIVITLFLLYQKPYNLKESSKDKNRANIEIIDMTNYSLNQSGVGSIIKAKKVLRFDTHDEFYNINAVRKTKDNLLENMVADSGKLIGNDLSFRGNVRYINSEDKKFKSQEADYNLKTKVFKSDVDFILEDNRTITHGTSMLYKSNEGKIYINNIKSKTEVDNK